jgi:hypothetical protein
MSRVGRRLLVLVGALALLACGEDASSDGTPAGAGGGGSGGGTGGTGGAAPPGPDTLQEFCQVLSQKICELAAPCCLTQELDVPQCIERRTLGCESEYGSHEYDASLAGECLRAYETLGDCFWGQNELAPCRSLANARSEFGGPCQSALDCLGSSTQGAACSENVCVAVPYLKEGADCSDSSAGQCRPPLNCRNSLTSSARTCESSLPLGAPCEPGGGCASAACDMETLTCVEIPADTFCLSRG